MKQNHIVTEILSIIIEKGRVTALGLIALCILTYADSTQYGYLSNDLKYLLYLGFSISLIVIVLSLFGRDTDAKVNKPEPNEAISLKQMDYRIGIELSELVDSYEGRLPEEVITGLMHRAKKHFNLCDRTDLANDAQNKIDELRPPPLDPN